ncbi:MAG: hypothetical protein HND52_18620 [Ignavibacteriae bacterium]|nr:hypothetical protein [Ignavibacteriota bacterium]NOG99978.1 hypothetical protein [Ignavibacteriota bacterium]
MKITQLLSALAFILFISAASISAQTNYTSRANKIDELLSNEFFNSSVLAFSILIHKDVEKDKIARSFIDKLCEILCETD